ncbi:MULTISPECIES: ATP-binding protein [Aliiglaciecola]|uniref:ATP-binding protein n=1 Tax=Aliiglaciecola TaxID=1406885 RepID=UPI001C09B56E|nr:MULTISPECIES: ATP-binding protein [Aliiglaciecola]MBU2878214.1 GHKL domain-containing protein [Aliiglaciecola lipolytica]MDO6711875.1 ATP-binding protein [Aliiglaciecola sp. 2_MG-2023]MDO6752951.1 ATP-binding protein [Aliiglaciecola sp. 1_MG-2023]
MIRLSLRLRSFAAALLALLLFIPLGAMTLEQAYTDSLSQSMLEQLRVQSLTLISEFEMVDGEPEMPEQLFNDKLNIPGSGLYAFIKINDDVVWQSLSTLNWSEQPQLDAPIIGKEIFLAEFSLDADYFLYSYTAEFEGNVDFEPVSFFIVQDKLTFEKERDAFSNTLWYWLGFLALLLLIVLIASLNMALSPINTLIGQIKKTEEGDIERLQQTYPPELEKLKRSINHLLDTEQQQRSRYKNSLSDLAHSLKTPLAVLAGNPNLPSSANEPLSQINNIIQRQLKRAVAGAGSGWDQAVSVLPIVQKLQSAMAKVHADKDLSISLQIAENCQFKGDQTDLMELLGNLMDNACKAAKSKVKVSAQQTNKLLRITVEDDGNGIEPQHRQELLHRGKRLDSYQEGQGIGMAVVTDLISAYHGKMEITDSTLGGAKIEMTFTRMPD